ncbi:hypothetical protein L0F81_00150 [Streptomyces tricolor]|uniref:Uncharacterized protein n=1 Tax=Streptomyces tricolor TaxID=68277 RepID=A0ABS9J818_9ACTN|nr:hypothetical protein [Streptomyces tricolor]MCG0061710.1 hypothetical protein [Streptomyces tricolor]
MSTLTLISSEDPFETVVAKAEAAVRAGFIADYLAATDAIDRAYIAYQVALYDEANPDELPLMDEIRGLHLPAAA